MLCIAKLGLFSCTRCGSADLPCWALFRIFILLERAVEQYMTFEESIDTVFAMTAPQPSSKAFFMTA